MFFATSTVHLITAIRALSFSNAMTRWVDADPIRTLEAVGTGVVFAFPFVLTVWTVYVAVTSMTKISAAPIPASESFFVTNTVQLVTAI